METVGDILERDEQRAGPQAAKPIRLQTLDGTPELPAPGIYFGLDETLYHALPALGSHDIQRLIASPMLFWANCTWLSEDARQRAADEAAKPDSRVWRTIGRAYHCRLLEGAAEYQARYAVDLTAEDCKDALASTDEIKAAIAHLGGKPASKVPDTLPDGTAYMRAAKKEDWTAQLLALDPDAKILSELKRQHAEKHAGKAFIPFEAHKQIETAARMIEADEQICHALQGGYPEVTLIWHDPETGAPCKARVDRLKQRAAIDLKSIANRGERSIESAIKGALHAYKYTVQPSHYLSGINAVRELVRTWPEKTAGDWLRWHKENAAPAEALTWAVRWAAETEEPVWWWLFQQKGFAPITRLMRYRGELSTRIATDEIRRQALRRFAQFAEAYGPNEPWIDSAPPTDITDDDFRDSIIEF